MKPIHLALIAGGALLLFRKRATAQGTVAPRGEAVKLPPVTVYAPVDKPIPFPTDFQYEEMPVFPDSTTTRSQGLLERIFTVVPEWLKVQQGQI